MTRLALMLGLLLSSASVRATTGARSIAMPLSVRQMGMGDVSLGGIDVLRAWSNPALLGRQRSRGEAAINGSSMFGAEATRIGMGVGVVINQNWAVGLLASTYGVGFAQLDALGTVTGQNLSQRSTSAGLVGSARFGVVALGVTGKWISDSVGGVTASAAGGDVGIAITPFDGMTAGVAYRNLGGALGTPVTGLVADALPSEIRGGAAYTIDTVRLTGGVEYVKPVDAPARIGLGMEWWPAPVVGLRGGVAGVSTVQTQITFGVSVAYGNIGVDYGVGAHPLGPIHRVSLAYRFGGGGSGEGETEPVVIGGGDKKSKSGPAPRVAVAVFDAKGGVAPGDAEAIVSLLRGELSQKASLRVLEQASSEATLRKYGLAAPCAGTGCAISIGKALKADRVVIGHMEKLLKRYFVNVRIVNVATGKVVLTEVAKGDSVDSLEVAIRNLASRIAKNLK